MQENNRLLALAKLKLGVKPKLVADECGISYGQALQLKKDLETAEERNAVHTLVNMEEAVFEELIGTVRQSLAVSAQTIGMEGELVTELDKIDDSLKATELLQKEMTDSAMQLAIKIRQLTLTSTSSDTILVLSEALSKLQAAFFAKGTNVQINQMGNSFETFLKD